MFAVAYSFYSNKDAIISKLWIVPSEEPFKPKTTHVSYYNSDIAAMCNIKCDRTTYSKEFQGDPGFYKFTIYKVFSKLLPRI
jgi:hypothetical protein